MDKGERIVIIIVKIVIFVMICFVIYMWVDIFETKSNNERLDKIEKELHELKTK